MSACITACCLAHRKVVFLQGWPPEDEGKWCHLTNWPCAEDPADAAAIAGTQCAVSAVPQPVERQSGPVTGSSRKLNDREWCRIVPGFEGRIIASGRGSSAYAWIDVRPERPAAATLFDLDEIPPHPATASGLRAAPKPKPRPAAEVVPVAGDLL